VQAQHKQLVYRLLYKTRKLINYVSLTISIKTLSIKTGYARTDPRYLVVSSGVCFEGVTNYVDLEMTKMKAFSFGNELITTLNRQSRNVEVEAYSNA
jgi:hypothetical protein